MQQRARLDSQWNLRLKLEFKIFSLVWHTEEDSILYTACSISLLRLFSVSSSRNQPQPQLMIINLAMSSIILVTLPARKSMEEKLSCQSYPILRILKPLTRQQQAALAPFNKTSETTASTINHMQSFRSCHPRRRCFIRSRNRILISRLPGSSRLHHRRQHSHRPQQSNRFHHQSQSKQIIFLLHLSSQSSRFSSHPCQRRLT